jgi:hypothetical protein
MSDSANLVRNIIFGRWRSQILYAGTSLGVFDHLSCDRPATASDVATTVAADPTLLYRLLRALSSIGLVVEDKTHGFRLSEAGNMLRSDHPRSLRALALLEEGPEHYAVWRHLVAILRDGRQEGFQREFGRGGFEYRRDNAAYGQIFDAAMSSNSLNETDSVLTALAGVDFSDVKMLCDIGGGQGHLACGFLRTYPHLHATVFDVPEVVSETDQLWAPRLGFSDRCDYVSGDMFAAVPPADSYVLKAILHDWNDTECIQILRNLRRAVRSPGRLYVVEFLITGVNEPDFARIFDIHMMCWGSGRERTPEEYITLFNEAGWRHTGTYHPSGGLRGIVTGVAA